MNRLKKKVGAFVLLLILFVNIGLSTVSASAATPETNSLAQTNVSLDDDGRIYPYIKAISNKNIWNYKRTTVTVGGKNLSVSGFIANGIAYIPFRAAAGAISGSTYSYNSSTKTSIMKAPGLEIYVSDGAYVTYANGRVLFNTTPCVIMSDGRLYLPASVFAKAVGMGVVSSSTKAELQGSYNPILTADKYYKSDEVFWLARIIHAESRGEPLLGQIAVGNVVLNRVKSAYYPNTIYGVIFDRKYGVQFSPILDGSIYNTPGYTATLAAKIALEGYDVSGGAFFFLNVKLATSSWIPQTRKYAFTVGNHDFYY